MPPSANFADCRTSAQVPDLTGATDPAFELKVQQQQARRVALVLCRVQQRLESRMLANTGIPVLTGGEASESGKEQRQTQIAPWHSVSATVEHAVACEAEAFAAVEELKLQDAIPDVVATSLVGVVAKLEMIVGADREIDDPTDFPWPHIASVLRDLKAIAGDVPAGRPERAEVRADITRHWQAATRLVAAVKEEENGPASQFEAEPSRRAF